MEKLMREVKAQLESWPAWLEAKTVVLAVSGGVDSMVMLRLMHELAWCEAFRRPAPTHRHRPCDAQRCTNSAFGRSHQRARFRSGSRHPRKPRHHDGRQNRYRHRPPPLHHRRDGQAHRLGQRPHHRRRQPRRTPRKTRPLRQTLGAPKRRFLERTR